MKLVQIGLVLAVAALAVAALFVLGVSTKRSNIYTAPAMAPVSPLKH